VRPGNGRERLALYEQASVYLSATPLAALSLKVVIDWTN
jgi:hypothetical protein